MVGYGRGEASGRCSRAIRATPRVSSGFFPLWPILKVRFRRFTVVHIDGWRVPIAIDQQQHPPGERIELQRLRRYTTGTGRHCRTPALPEIRQGTLTAHQHMPLPAWVDGMIPPGQHPPQQQQHQQQHATMDASLRSLVYYYLDTFMYTNAVFLCERLVASDPREENVLLLATCHVREGCELRGHSLLQGCRLPQSR